MITRVLGRSSGIGFSSGGCATQSFLETNFNCPGVSNVTSDSETKLTNDYLTISLNIFFLLSLSLV